MTEAALPSVQVHAFEVHARFGDLRAPSKLARLQLAALYAATSSLLPEPHSRMTGAQMAMQLLRQCWSNSPLTPEERRQLDSVGQLGGHLAAGLRPLVHELHLSAMQLAHLHIMSSADGDPPVGTDANCTYIQESSAGCFQGWAKNPRMLLSDEEELRALGGARRPGGCPPPPWFWSGSCHSQSVPACPVNAAWVVQMEAEVCHCVTESAGRAAPPYPLSMMAGALPLEKAMHDELEASWQATHQAPTFSLGLSRADLAERLKNWQVCGTECICGTKLTCFESFMLGHAAFRWYHFLPGHR